MKICISLWLLIMTSAAQAQIKKISVYFPFAESTPGFSETARLLYFISDSLPDKENYFIEIKAYCDNVDDDTVNNILSTQRAENIRSILLSNGLQAANINLCKGYGEKIALNKNVTEEERKMNRRAEISFISKKLSENEIGQLEKNGEQTKKIIKDSISTSDFTEGETLILDNLNFQPGRHILLPRSMPTLKQLLKAMQENPDLEIEIVGHICCEPGTVADGYDLDTKKQELSFNRAREIMSYLIKNGIDKNRMTIDGKGARQKLIDPEKTEQDMETNRRVEIVVKRS